MTDQHDDQIDNPLRALRNAPIPNGMEQRINQRLQQRASIISAAVPPTATWWRGALCGAAASALAFGLVLLIQRPHTAPPAPTPPASNISAPTRVATAPAKPCTPPAAMRVTRQVAPSSPEMMRISNPRRSHPAPAEPLTPEERQLVHLVHTADPRQLATLNPETQAKLDAQEAADFQKFFTPPPRPKPLDDDE